MHNLPRGLFLVGATIGIRASYTPPDPVYSIGVHPSLNIAAIGTTQGILSIIKTDDLSESEIKSFGIGHGPILYLEWNLVHTDTLAFITADSRVNIRRFNDLTSFTSDQSILLRHPLRVLSLCWDTTTQEALLVGTQEGYVDEYVVTFPDSPGPSETSINAESDRTNRWFIGCRVSFIYKPSSSMIVAGCEEGKIWYISKVQSSGPSDSVTLPRSTFLPTPRAMYRRAKGYFIALFDNIVYVFDAVDLQEGSRFRIRPRPGPNASDYGDNRILGMDVSFTANVDLDKLFVRTSDGVVQYDLDGIINKAVPTFSWLNNTSLLDLMGDRNAEILWSTTTLGDPSNDPVAEYNSTTGDLDVSACRTPDAFFKMNQNKTDVVCDQETPVVTVDLVLPFAIIYLEGQFDVRSLGTIPAMDCTAMKAPITSWDVGVKQVNQWTRVMPSTRVFQNDAACPLIQDTPSSQAIKTVDGCKTACLLRPECNMIFVRVRGDIRDNLDRPDEEREIEICTFHRCLTPEHAPVPSTMFTEIWTMTSGSRSWVAERYKPINQFGGFVAFGTDDLVIHGGCVATDGLIPTNSSVTVQLTPTYFSPAGESVLRFQISQYNAEAKVRVSNVSLNMLVNYTMYEQFYEEPSSGPGGYYFADPSVTGSPRGPIAVTSSGVLITTRDTSLVEIKN
jgi:hypothetical protein